MVGWASQPRLRHHVVFKGEAGPYGGLGAVVAALVLREPERCANAASYCRRLAWGAPRQEAAPKVLTVVPSPVPPACCWVVVDQQPLPVLPPTNPDTPAADPNHTIQAPPPPPPPPLPCAHLNLFEAVVGAAPRGRCLALVQHVHFLALGPSSTAPCSASLLQARSEQHLDGVVAVSGFMARYLQEHWPGQVGGGGGGGEGKGGRAGAGGRGRGAVWRGGGRWRRCGWRRWLCGVCLAARHTFPGLGEEVLQALRGWRHQQQQQGGGEAWACGLGGTGDRRRPGGWARAGGAAAAAGLRSQADAGEGDAGGAGPGAAHGGAGALTSTWWQLGRARCSLDHFNTQLRSGQTGPAGGRGAVHKLATDCW